MNEYIIIACSSRALTSSASRAGYSPFVIDCFTDCDTRDAAQSVYRAKLSDFNFDPDEVIAFVQACKKLNPDLKAIIGSGCDTDNDLLTRLEQVIPVLGNNLQTMSLIKDPERFFGLLSQHQILHPETITRGDDYSGNFVIKNKKGMGGIHVRPYQQGEELKHDEYLQGWVDGITMSAVFLANGTDAKVIGLNKQLQTNNFPETPCLYLGAIGAPDSDKFFLNQEQKSELNRIIKILTMETGLKGLCGIDFIVKESDEITVLEVNPRPPATFELHERTQSLFQQHINGCQGKAIDYTTNDDGFYYGSAVFYAKNKIILNNNFLWPDWVKDRPANDEIFERKQPVCTVRAKALEIDETESMLFDRLKRIESMIMSMQNAA